MTPGTDSIPQQTIDDDLFLLGIEDPSEDEINDVRTLEDASWWNSWYAANGYQDQVNEDYGELNWMAKLLGIKVTDNPEVIPNTL